MLTAALNPFISALVLALVVMALVMVGLLVRKNREAKENATLRSMLVALRKQEKVNDRITIVDVDTNALVTLLGRNFDESKMAYHALLTRRHQEDSSSKLEIIKTGCDTIIAGLEILRVRDQAEEAHVESIERLLDTIGNKIDRCKRTVSDPAALSRKVDELSEQIVEIESRKSNLPPLKEQVDLLQTRVDMLVEATIGGQIDQDLEKRLTEIGKQVLYLVEFTVKRKSPSAHI